MQKENFKAYGNLPGTAGLYTLLPEGVARRARIQQAWRQEILTRLGGHQISTPILIPSTRLQESGHTKEFEGQLYSVDKDLMLRPETAQAIFADYKTLRMSLRGSPLVIGQVGKAYRKEKSTRSSNLRCREFQQMEIEIFCQQERHYQEALKLLQQSLSSFFQRIGLQGVRSVSLEKDALPHYCRATTDFYYKDWEIGCINDRGTHDLGGVRVLQLSLGLTRIAALSA